MTLKYQASFSRRNSFGYQKNQRKNQKEFVLILLRELDGVIRSWTGGKMKLEVVN